MLYRDGRRALAQLKPTLNGTTGKAVEDRAITLLFKEYLQPDRIKTHCPWGQVVVQTQSVVCMASGGGGASGIRYDKDKFGD